MSNNSTFNTCSRCGSANTLSAKYCYQCGAQLKVPNEPKACPQCNTINSGLSKFCSSCGATLTGNTQVKHCPQCHRQIPATQIVCDCGYSFDYDNNRRAKVKGGHSNQPAKLPQNEKAVAMQSNAYQPTQQAASVPASKEKRVGRLGALVSLIFILVFAYLMFAFGPLRFWQDLWDYVPLYTIAGMSLGINMYDFVALTIESIQAGTVPLDVHSIMMYVLVGLTALCLVIHFIVSLIRLIAGRKAGKKSSNKLYLILFILILIVSALLFCSTIPALNFLSIFAPADGATVGYMVFAPALYFFLFWFVSLFGAKKKKDK